MQRDTLKRMTLMMPETFYGRIQKESYYYLSNGILVKSEHRYLGHDYLVLNSYLFFDYKHMG